MAIKTKAKKAATPKTKKSAAAAEEKVKKTKKAAKATEPKKVKKTKKAAAEKPVKTKKSKVAKAEKPVKTKKTKTLKAEKPSKSTKAKSTKTTKAKSAKAQKAKADLPKPMKEKLNKTQLYQHLADQTGLEKKDIKKVMESLEETMIASVRKKGVGEFMFPGLFKVVTKHIAAKKGGEKKISFGKEIITKAKPATTRVKVRPMKKLKDAAVA